MPSFNAASLLVVASLMASSVLAMPSLGHHAPPELITLSHLPAVVGTYSEEGLIETTVVPDLSPSKRDIAYYGDATGLTPPPMLGTRKRSLPSGWSSLGCVTEGTTSRALSSYSYTDPKLTLESCLASCLAKGYTMAGTEWSTECYCGNSFSAGGVTSDSSQCSMSCAGNSAELCGGNYHLSAFQYTASSTSSSSTTCASSVASAVASASKSASSAIASASSAASASASSKASSSTSSAPLATATSTSTSTEWESLGCFVDNPNKQNGLHVLQGTSLTGQTNMTPALCQARCQAQGYNFAGVEYGQECWCGDLTTTQLGALVNNSPWCNVACTGDSSQSCGGGWSLQLYEQVDISDC